MGADPQAHTQTHDRDLGQRRRHWTFRSKGRGTIMPWLQLQLSKQLVTRTQSSRRTEWLGELARVRLSSLASWEF